MGIEIQPQITIDSKVLSGKPLIAGTRISVDFVLELLASGLNTEDILREYPHLTREGIQAALNYAMQLMRNEEVFPLEIPATK